MAFMIAASPKAATHDWYLDSSCMEWTLKEEDAFQTESWSEIERLYKKFTDELHEHDSRRKPVSELLRKAFPTSAGTLLIVERVIKRVATRVVVLR